MNNLSTNIDQLWDYIVRELPDNLDGSALETGALIRKKGVESATDLLRIILTYGITDLSFKNVAVWASASEISDISSVSIFNRIRDAKDWLSYLIAATLNKKASLPHVCAGLPVRIVDATVVTGPGAVGTEWRLHTEIDPKSGQITGVILTDHTGAESYKNFIVSPETVYIGDRCYALATGIEHVHDGSGYVIARTNLCSIRICHPDHTIFKPLQETDKIPKLGVVKFDILIPTAPKKTTRSHKTWKLEEATKWIPARLLAVRTIEDKIMWIITTVPEEIISNEVIMELYRVRWQIELEFKRLKSLLSLDELPSRRGPTAQSWILARILAAILVENLLNSRDFSPWGYQL